MAFGLPGYNIVPINYNGKDGIVFHKRDDMSVFLKLSATTDMTFSSPMDVTSQPVQTGQVVTDNVQEKPNTIQINGVVVVGYEGAFFLAQNTTVVEDFVTTLQLWRTQRQVLRVMCKDGLSLENAVCTNFEAKKDARIDNGLNISLTFQDVNFVAQIGQTTVASENSNGSKGTVKTKDGSVTNKKDVGKTGTKNSPPPKVYCDVVNSRTDNASWLSAAKNSCASAKNVSSTGKVTYGTDLFGNRPESYAPKSVQNAYGFNPNKG